MPFQRSKTQLEITQDQRDVLFRIASSRTDQARRVERARLLLLLADGQHPNDIGKQLNMKPLKIYRLLHKARELRPIMELDDLKRSGRPPLRLHRRHVFGSHPRLVRSQKILDIPTNYGQRVY